MLSNRAGETVAAGSLVTVTIYSRVVPARRQPKKPVAIPVRRRSRQLRFPTWSENLQSSQGGGCGSRSGAKYRLATQAASDRGALTVFAQDPLPGTMLAPAADVWLNIGTAAAAERSAVVASQPAMSSSRRFEQLSRVAVTPQPDEAAEVLEPQSGLLQIETVDLTIKAGAISLEVRRVLADGGSLLGHRWRLNWEKRLMRAGSLAAIDAPPGSLPFVVAKDGDPARFTSPRGDVLVCRVDRSLCTYADGATDTLMNKAAGLNIPMPTVTVLY